MSNEYIDELVDHLTFEHSVYHKVAGSTNYFIITIPNKEGIGDEEYVSTFVEDCNSRGYIPIIKAINSSYVVISSPNTTVTALMSKSSLQGFEC
jgi:hypothetical protein